MRRAFFGVTLALLVACASVADLDVTYQPEQVDTVEAGAEAGLEASSPRNVARSVIDAAVPQRPDREDPILEGCVQDPDPAAGIDGGPCDTSAGVGCCITGGQKPVCMANTAINSECSSAIFVGCRQSLNDIPCCWRQIGTVLVALPGDCEDAGAAPACLVDDDCPINVKCEAKICSGVMVGRCGEALPCSP